MKLGELNPGNQIVTQASMVVLRKGSLREEQIVDKIKKTIMLMTISNGSQKSELKPRKATTNHHLKSELPMMTLRTNNTNNLLVKSSVVNKNLKRT